MKILKGFYHFWYDFIIGDDWKIAVAVALVLIVGILVVLNGSYNEHVLTPLLALGVAGAFTTALLIDVRPQNK